MDYLLNLEKSKSESDCTKKPTYSQTPQPSIKHGFNKDIEKELQNVFINKVKGKAKVIGVLLIYII